MQIAYIILAAFLLFFTILTSQCEGLSPPYGAKDSPWFTGPLLTPSARVVAPGHYVLEPYLYWTEFNGIYTNDWRQKSLPKFYEITTQLVYKIGIIEGVNIGGNIQEFYGWTRGKSAFAFGDMPIGFDLEVYKGTHWFLKLSLQEIFPTGKYDKLDPKKLGTDIGGAGSYVTSAAFTIGHLHHFCGDHFLSTRLNIAFFAPAPVGVKGLNVFGGDPSTSGRVYPGNAISLFLGAEYSLTKNWSLACDIGGQYSGKNHFKGKSLVPVGTPSSAQFSVAPAIEYNWNETVGLIAGTWFTFAGRNSSRFINAVVAVNINF